MFRLATPQNTPRGRAPAGTVSPIQIPSKGLNARAPYSVMEQGYAVALNNVIAESIGLKVRKGWREWASGLPGGDIPVSTIMHYFPAGGYPVPISSIPSFTQAPPGNLFAAKDGDIYDITAGGLGPWVAEAGVTGSTDFWTSLNLQNAAGSFLLATNDGGGYAYFNGTAWTTPTFGTGTGQVSGCDPSKLVYLCTFKKRVWFVEKESTSAWYLPVDAITGALTEFDFGAGFDHGGVLVALENWTIDSGAGMDDQLVAVSSMGDVVIYSGLDPSDATNFQLVGVYYAGPLPAGRRQVKASGGDVYILSQFGMQQVSKLLTPTSLSAEVQQHQTYVIDPLIAGIMSSYSNFNGWQIVDCAREELEMIGIPNEVTDYAGDFLAYKTTTQSWSILKDTTWQHILNVDNNIFAGTLDGRVAKIFYGALDDVSYDGTSGTLINCRVTPAYSLLEKPSTQKRFMLLRPCFISVTVPVIQVTIRVDYSLPQPTNVPTVPTSVGGRWDVSLWDTGLWAGIRPTIREWIGIHGQGFAVAPQIDFVCGGETMLTSIDIWWEDGGVL